MSICGVWVAFWQVVYISIKYHTLFYFRGILHTFYIYIPFLFYYPSYIFLHFPNLTPTPHSSSLSRSSAFFFCFIYSSFPLFTFPLLYLLVFFSIHFVFLSACAKNSTYLFHIFTLTHVCLICVSFLLYLLFHSFFQKCLINGLSYRVTPRSISCIKYLWYCR